MTDRERWTIYPLLFLTLGIAVRDKISKSITTENLTSENVAVTKNLSSPAFTSNTVRCKTVACNALVLADPEGRQQVAIKASPAGGLVLQLPDDKEVRNIVLGYSSDEIVGLAFIDAHGILHLPVWVQTPHKPAAKPGGEAPRDEQSDEQPAEPASEK